MSDRDRSSHMKAFLARSGWGDAVVTPLAGDASTRRYARLALGGRKAMLMDQPQHAEAPAAPADAGEEARRALGYNAVARLAGADTARFVAAARWLKEHGLAAPDIYDADPALGFVILEDLGDALFAEVLADGGNALVCTARKLRPLRKKHHSAPILTSTIPAKRGPRKRARLNLSELRAMAFPRSSLRSTISVMKVCRPGMS